MQLPYNEAPSGILTQGCVVCSWTLRNTSLASGDTYSPIQSVTYKIIRSMMTIILDVFNPWHQMYSPNFTAKTLCGPKHNSHTEVWPQKHIQIEQCTLPGRVQAPWSRIKTRQIVEKMGQCWANTHEILCIPGIPRIINTEIGCVFMAPPTRWHLWGTVELQISAREL